MVGFPVIKERGGLTAKLGVLVAVKAPALAEVTQHVDLPKLCAIPPCVRRSALSL